MTNRITRLRDAIKPLCAVTASQVEPNRRAAGPLGLESFAEDEKRQQAWGGTVTLGKIRPLNRRTPPCYPPLLQKQGAWATISKSAEQARGGWFLFQRWPEEIADWLPSWGTAASERNYFPREPEANTDTAQVNLTAKMPSNQSDPSQPHICPEKSPAWEQNHSVPRSCLKCHLSAKLLLVSPRESIMLSFH